MYNALSVNYINFYYTYIRILNRSIESRDTYEIWFNQNEFTCKRQGLILPARQSCFWVLQNLPWFFLRSTVEQPKVTNAISRDCLENIRESCLTALLMPLENWNVWFVVTWPFLLKPCNNGPIYTWYCLKPYLMLCKKITNHLQPLNTKFGQSLAKLIPIPDTFSRFSLFEIKVKCIYLFPEANDNLLINS